MNLHTDQATLDHWRTTGTWVMFGEGDRCPELGCDRYSQHTHPPDWMVEAAKPCETCDPKNWDGDPAMIEHLHQHGVLRDTSLAETGYPCCIDGRQRHTITVPCESCEGRGFNMIQLSPTSQEVSWCTNPDCIDGCITVPELAVVEWGPLVVVTPETHGPHDLTNHILVGPEPWHSVWRYTPKPQRLTLPPNIDPQSLVGQYAIGGRLVNASS